MGAADTCSVPPSAFLAAASSNSIFGTIKYFCLCVLALPSAIWLVSYLIPQIYMAIIRSTPDLKKRYKCDWALVTGAGSGIGKAIALALASQGLNVVLVSLDDKFLQETMEEIQKKYPKQQFRSVGVTFSPPTQSYMDKIIKTVEDIHDNIRIIFCNAGYMVTGFLDQTSIDKLQSNIECNAISAIAISHYFTQRLVTNRTNGCIVFTSSVAGFIPTPFAAMYATTKAMISQYAACLHIEVQPLGIDVCAIHPSPVASNFYSNLSHKVDMIEAAAKNAINPNDITNDIFKSIGCCAYRDLGGTYYKYEYKHAYYLIFNFF
jgi:short-subunit dehydrogenase